MCVFGRPADAKGTYEYIGVQLHPKVGEVNVLAYQNTVVSLVPGREGAETANAMLLHIPSRDFLDETHFIDTTGFPNILKDMKNALQPVSRSSYPYGPVAKGRTAVFELGIYHVVSSTDAMLIPRALQEVPAYKRPPITEAMMGFFKTLYGWPMALACFNTKQAREANPIMLWYRPLDSNLLQAPAIDCHTGDVPDLTQMVDVDHWVFFSSYKMPRGYGKEVDYSDHIPSYARGFLPDQVIGAKFEGRERNGDWGLKARDVESGIRGMHNVQRLLPPGM